MRAATSFTAAAVLAVAFSLAASAAPRQEGEGPPIEELQITVQDLSTKKLLDPLNPGDVLTLQVGDEVRLRMVAITAGRQRAPRYPSTRFAPLAGTNRIRVDRVNEEVGAAVVTAVSTSNPGNESAVTLVSYELLEPLNIRRGLMKGTVSVKVVDRESSQAPSTPPASGSNTPPGELRGATLFNETDFRGVSQTFYYDTRTLSDTRIGHDATRSIRVDPNCRVTLYEHGDFEGSSTQLSQDVADLSATRVGSDRVSSLRVSCEGQASQRGVTLYTETGFRGRGVTFDRGTTRLGTTALGSDRARSVKVDEGCRAVLYADEGFRGDASVISEDTADLGELRIGNDRASSIEVFCE